MKSHRRSLAWILILSGLLLLTNPSSSFAEGPPDLEPETPVPSGGGEEPARTYTQPASDVTAATTTSWRCFLDVHHPHKSGHVPGTINVTGEINCTVVMQRLTISTTLQKRSCFWIFCSWSNVGSTGTVTNYNTTHVSSNSAASCQNGTYRGRSTAVMVWPSGETEYGVNYSANVSINC